MFWPTALGNDRIKGADRRVLIGYATAWCVCIGTVFAMLLVQLSRR